MAIRGQHLVGRELGSCTLEKLLGYGGSSAVFLAKQRSPQRKVAVKVFLPRFNMSSHMQKNFYNRFIREAEAASGLDHPHILAIYSYGEQDGLPYIVMPYMAGGTLYDYIRKNGPLSLEEGAVYLEQIASALDYAHENNCVHCDVKPANILLDNDGCAVLSDFGIAQVMPSGVHAQQQSSSETLMGTPDYISPEQALGQPLDGRSDVYSLGITLFNLLTGNPPFKADDSIAMALLHVHENPPPLSLHRIDSTPSIDHALDKALAKWPEDRYQSAGEFSAAFSRAVLSATNASPHPKGGIIGKALSTSGAWKNFSDAEPAVPTKRGQLFRSPVARNVLLVVLLMAVLTASFLIATTILSLRSNAHTQGNPTSTTTPVVKSVRAVPSNLFEDSSAWDQSTPFSYLMNGECEIKNTSSKFAVLMLYDGATYTNFHLSVTTTQIQAASNNDYSGYGIVFRSKSQYYLFEVLQGGLYRFSRYDGQDKNGIDIRKVLDSRYDPSLSLALKKSNTITIEAKGNTFNFSINGKPVGKPITDSSKPSLSIGRVGLFVEGQNTDVTFSNLHVDQLD